MHVASVLYSLAMLFVATINGQDGAGIFPRRSSLTGVWPLNAFHGAKDVSGNNFHGSLMSDAYADTSAGPFGDPQTSYKSSKTGIFTAMDARLVLNSSFTISFFVKASPARNYYTGVFQWFDKFGAQQQPLSMSYGSDTLTDTGYLHPYAQGKWVGSQVQIHPKVWNFHAITFTAGQCTLSTYNRFGMNVRAQYLPEVCNSFQYNNNGFKLGATYANTAFSSSMSISCLVIYKTDLTASELLQVHDACRVTLNAPPCGTPRLPAIPSVPALPPVAARWGQFPSTASLRLYRNHRCTVSIIHPYWVVTTASCLDLSASSANYDVLAGLHDLALTTSSFIQTIGVKSWIIHNGYSSNAGISYQNDIALVELSSPIDFGSPYTNDACLPWYGNDADVNTTAATYLAGWGTNGRSSLASATALRYISGTVRTNSECVNKWGSSIFKQDNTMMCMQSSYATDVPCFGDNGAALTVPVGEHYQRMVSIGLYSFRDQACTSTSSPPVFTKLDAYMPWIISKIGCTLPGYLYPVSCPQ